MMRHGFSLVEVVLSMVLVTVGVLTLMLFLPQAITAHERARFQLYAAAKAMELVEFQATSMVSNGGANFALEADQPWATPSGYRAWAPDLEVKNTGTRQLLQPLPKVIAERLEDQRGEIRQLLAEGGQLFYAHPKPSSGLRIDSPLEPTPPNESFRTVIGVVGNPQQNALGLIPWKGWPYTQPWPSPLPYTGKDAPDWAGPVDQWNTMPSSEIHGFERNLDQVDMDILWRSHLADPGGVWNWSGTIGNSATPASLWRIPTGMRAYTMWGSTHVAMRGSSRDGWFHARGQMVMTLWYAWKKGMPASILFGRATEADLKALTDPHQIRALNYLAHAGMCMTKWYALEPRASALPLRHWRHVVESWTILGSSQTALAPETGPSWVQFDLSPVPPNDGLRMGIPLPGDDDPTYPTVEFNITMPTPLTMQQLLAVLPAGAGSNPFMLASLATYNASPASHPHRSRPTYVDGNVYITHDMVVNWHESLMKVVMRETAKNPYDWGIPRPLERQLFTDHPLLQYDLIADPADRLAGPIPGLAGDSHVDASWASTGNQAQQWRPIAARDITNMGMNSFGTSFDWTTLKGDQSHFNLTQPFAPSERTRQLVFWSVDWANYQDAETAPSAPIDASRYPLSRSQSSGDFTYNVMGGPWFGSTMWGDRGRYLWGNPTAEWWDQWQPSTRNPEKGRLFMFDMQDFPPGSGTPMPSGQSIMFYTVGPDSGHNPGHSDNGNFIHRTGDYSWDGGIENMDRADRGFKECQDTHRWYGYKVADPKTVFSGLYGADRNGNQLLDRGTLPSSVRLRATEVARFNYYDPRLTMSTR